MPLQKEFALANAPGSVTIPALGLGTFQPSPAPLQVVKTAVLHALRAGYRHIDAAFAYDNGEVEKAVGLALREWEGRREDVWITTKLYVLQQMPRDFSRVRRSNYHSFQTEHVPYSHGR